MYRVIFEFIGGHCLCVSFSTSWATIDELDPVLSSCPVGRVGKEADWAAGGIRRVKDVKSYLTKRRGIKFKTNYRLRFLIYIRLWNVCLINFLRLFFSRPPSLLSSKWSDNWKMVTISGTAMQERERPCIWTLWSAGRAINWTLANLHIKMILHLVTGR